MYVHVFIFILFLIFLNNKNKNKNKMFVDRQTSNKSLSNIGWKLMDFDYDIKWMLTTIQLWHPTTRWLVTQRPMTRQTCHCGNRWCGGWRRNKHVIAAMGDAMANDAIDASLQRPMTWHCNDGECNVAAMADVTLQFA